MIEGWLSRNLTSKYPKLFLSLLRLVKSGEDVIYVFNLASRKRHIWQHAGPDAEANGPESSEAHIGHWWTLNPWNSCGAVESTGRPFFFHQFHGSFMGHSWVIHGSVQAIVSSTPCRTSSFCIGYCDVERNKDATCQALPIGLRGGSDIHIEQGSVKQDAQILLQPTWQVEVKFCSHIWYAETVIVETWPHEVSLSFFLKLMHTILGLPW